MRHILCFGNPLHGDDGFGPEVYHRLTALPRPPELRLIDAGTPGMAALNLFRDCEEALIVDIAAPQGQPGQLLQLSPEMVAAESVRVGHAIGVGYLLRALASLGEPMPRIHILVVEATEIVPFKPGLSPAVNAAVNMAITLISQRYFREAS